ncbi:MAG: hypothetical protein JXA42_17945 [Anaerolineales bacterium]|nr:hypothetical protein [Anaerolineales bacterium]
MKKILMVMCQVVICLVFVACSTKEIKEEEKALLVTIRDLEGYGVIVKYPAKGESFQVKTNLGDSTEIEYEYDSEKDPESTENLWIKSEAEILDNDELASTEFDDRISAYKLGAFLGNSDVEIREDPELFSLGDENFSAYFELDGKKFGNVLVVRKGNVVLSLLIAGLYFDDPLLLHELMAPRLKQVDSIGSE